MVAQVVNRARPERRHVLECLPAELRALAPREVMGQVAIEIATGRRYVPLAFVAHITGLTPHHLHHYRMPLTWGVPGDWRLIRNVTYYGVHRLEELADVLADWDEIASADRLRAFVAEFNRVTAPPFSSAAGWLNDWEASQE